MLDPAPYQFYLPILSFIPRIELIQRHPVLQLALVELEVEDHPGGVVGPLFGDVDPRGQVVPVEVDVECLHQSACRTAESGALEENVQKEQRNIRNF